MVWISSSLERFLVTLLISVSCWSFIFYITRLFFFSSFTHWSCFSRNCCYISKLHLTDLCFCFDKHLIWFGVQWLRWIFVACFWGNGYPAWEAKKMVQHCWFIQWVEAAMVPFWLISSVLLSPTGDINDATARCAVFIVARGVVEAVDSGKTCVALTLVFLHLWPISACLFFPFYFQGQPLFFFFPLLLSISWLSC